MNNLMEILNKANIPVWIIKNNNVEFINNEFINKFKTENEKLNILNDNTLGYFENIIIKDRIYNKLLIPMGSNDILLGLLIRQEKNNSIDMFNLLIDSIPEMIFCKDNKLNYTIINKQCEDFYKSRGVDEILGRTDLDFDLDREFVQTCTDHDKIVLETKKPLYIEEKVPVQDGDGFIYYQTIKTPIIDENGLIKGLIGSVRDITAQKKIEEKLRFLSYRDILTGLYNRTYFDEKIDEIIKEDFQVGVIVGDLNGLKIINDIFGHLEGDKLIKKASEILKSMENENIYIFRWGGDEFVTLIMNASEQDCEKYISCINKLCKEASLNNHNISISQGYAIFNSKDDSIDNILREADKMLYMNKDLNKKLVSRSMIDKIMTNLNKKGIETDRHINSISNISMKIAEIMGFDYTELERLRLLCLLHDIGKSAIDEDILLKKGKLSNEEYMIVKNHSKIGYKLATLIPGISHIAEEILHHHERWDGKGYPNGLVGEEIPLLCRIVNIAESFDIMTNGTIYKDKISKEDAILEIKKNSGIQFDPDIVNIFLQII